MRSTLVASVCLVSMALPTAAEMACEGTVVTVDTTDSRVAEMVCASAVRAESLFEQCNVPKLEKPVQINVVDALMPRCVAVYHCGEDMIEVLPPKLMDEKREEESAFSFLPIDAYFKSVIIHELTHAAFDDVPCPFNSCTVSNEYVAYTIQVESLTPEQKKEFAETAALDRRIFRDELNMLIYEMAPHLFAQKAWVHFTQRDDPCGFIGQISDGTVLLDYERFE